MWDAFSARVTIRRQVMTAEGTGANPAEASSEELLWQRVKTASGWRTTMTVLSSSRPTVQSRTGAGPLATAAAVTRVEDSEDGSAPRFFTREGVQIAMPSGVRRDRFRRPDAVGLDPELIEQARRGRAIARPAEGREWIRSMVMSAALRSDRLRSFDRQFGRRTGALHGVGRYVHDEGDSRREVLVDEQGAVPIESNLVRNGALVSHTTFAYEQAASGVLVRRGVRHEQLVSGQRVISEVSYGDIRLDQNGGR